MTSHQLLDEIVRRVGDAGIQFSHSPVVPGESREPKRSQLLGVRLFHLRTLHVDGLNL